MIGNTLKIQDIPDGNYFVFIDSGFVDAKRYYYAQRDGARDYVKDNIPWSGVKLYGVEHFCQKRGQVLNGYPLSYGFLSTRFDGRYNGVVFDTLNLAVTFARKTACS